MPTVVQAKPQVTAPTIQPRLPPPSSLKEVALPAPVLVAEAVRQMRTALQQANLPRSPVALHWDVLTQAWRVTLLDFDRQEAKKELRAVWRMSKNSNIHKVTQGLLKTLGRELHDFFVRRDRLGDKNPFLSDQELSFKAAEKPKRIGRSPRICKEFLPPSEQIRKVFSRILRDPAARYASAPEAITQRPTAMTPMVAALDLTTRQLTIMTDWQWQERSNQRDFKPTFLVRRFYLSTGLVLARLASSVRQELCQGLRQLQAQSRSGMERVGYDHYSKVSYRLESEAETHYRSESEFIPMEEL